MSLKISKNLLIFLFALLLTASNVFAMSDIQKEARSEVFKALKEKKIETADMQSLLGEIDKGDPFASAVLEKVKNMKKRAGMKGPVGFRGDGTGVYADVTPPTEWSMNYAGSNKNIVWQTPLPSTSPSSVIAVGDALYTLGNDFDLICMDKKTGKIRWVKPFGPYEIATKEERASNKKLDDLVIARDSILKTMPGYGAADVVTKGAENYKLEKDIQNLLTVVNEAKFNSAEQDEGFGNSTPASDGVNIYAWNALGVTACFTPEGEMKWIKSQPIPHMHHGYHSSPIIVDGKVIVYQKTYIAYDAKTGDKLWEVPTGGFPNELLYSTPVAVKIGGVSCFIEGNGSIMRASDGKHVAKSKAVWGFASATYGSGYTCMIGPQAWAHPEEIVVYYKLPSSASEITSPQMRVYPFSTQSEASPAGDQCFQSSPVIKDGLLYFVFSRGDFYCFDLEKGSYVYTVKLDPDEVVMDARPYRSGVLASICLANNLLYVMSDQGTTFVIEPGPKYKLISKNSINQIFDYGDWRGKKVEGTISTPFFEGNHIFYRAQRNMYCIGLPGKAFVE